MDRVMKSLMERPDVVQEVAGLLFGDGAWEISKALTQEKKDKALHQVALGTNLVGSVAGPAAVYSAVKHRKEGGIPRDLATSAGPKMSKMKSPTLRKIGRGLEGATGKLNAPGGRKTKIAAGVAGASLVGLQGINWSGDVISTKILRDQNKKKVAKRDVVRKAIEAKKETPKGKLVKIGVNSGFAAAKQAPVVVRNAKGVNDKMKSKITTVNKEFDMEIRGEISKVDTDKRQVFGWASIIELDGKPVVDLQGDYMDVDTVEKAAYDYVQNSRKGGNQHAREGEVAKHVSDLVESFVVTDEKKAQMGLPASVPTGWWVGFKVSDDDTWAQVKNGERKEFSIHGSGVRKNIDMED